jgi:hypothetical protein
MPMGQNPGDTYWGRKLAGIMPMANGGYDNYLPTLGVNLVDAMKSGMAVLYTIGDQDPGYNAIGYFAYNSLMSANAQPGKYYTKVIAGGTHSANVWNPPFYLNSRIWSTKMNAWSQMWALRRNITPPPAPINPLHAKIWVDSLIINYPNTVVHIRDSSTGKHTFVSYGATAYPTGFPGVWWSAYGSGDMLFANLVDGNYKIQMVIGDDTWTDTAFVNVRVYGPPACPPPPVCPPPRNVIGFTIDAITGKFRFTYDDGSSQ